MCGTVVIIQQSEFGARAWPVRCKSWLCPRCLPVRRRQLRAKAFGGNPTTFITLTSNPHIGIDPTDRARILVSGWRQLLKEIEKRYHYGKIAYLAVMEATKRGEPHLHVLCRTKYIDQRWLSQTWEALTGAKIVHIRKVESNEQASRYVAKYTSKSPQRYGTMKRYWCSRDYARGPKRQLDNESWRGCIVVQAGVSIAAVIAAWHEAGLEFEVSRGGFCQTTGPPAGPVPYSI